MGGFKCLLTKYVMGINVEYMLHVFKYTKDVTGFHCQTSNTTKDQTKVWQFENRYRTRDAATKTCSKNSHIKYSIIHGSYVSS